MNESERFKKQWSTDNGTGKASNQRKLQWYYAPIFAAFWLILYFTIVITQFNRLPNILTLKDEIKQPDAFIAERASAIQLKLASIGPKVVGSEANEIRAVDLIKSEIEDVRANLSDYFEIEMDIQSASGSYIHWTMINMYQAVQNIVVRLSPQKQSSSSSSAVSDKYLLINSHFDSAIGSPGAGDDGAMVSVMLEVMRVIAKSNGPLKHPIVFLFNGAEENPLQASHAFITQHKWAKNCKALINLDAAGSAGREILFQSGPKHSWIMNYYRKVPHPFATSVAEEIFQANIIPSDTDFRIFRDFGHVPGLDMAYTLNGYVYHTKYDRYNTFPTASLQNTGDNVLSLAKAIGNAPEMFDSTKQQQANDGNAVFYDFLGWFMIFYTETISIIINVVVCVAGLATIGVSLHFMRICSALSWIEIFKRYGISFAIQLISLALGSGLTELVAAFMDAVGCSMSWFNQNWLIIGIFFCPMFFGMGILPSLYSEYVKRDKLRLSFRVQLFMHSHCLFLILLTISMTIADIRSAYLPMMAVFFQTIALVINLVTKFHQKDFLFAIVTIISQILPFVYYTTIAQVLYGAMIPMTARSGSETNPDIAMAAISAITSIHFAGFIIPLFLLFRKTRTVICTFLGLTLLFIVLAVTPVGFPYKERTAPQRFNILHARRILHNANDSIRLDESGVFFYPLDRRFNDADKYIKSIGKMQSLNEYCDSEMFCGMPLFNHRWHKARESCYWIPMDEQPNIPATRPKLLLNSVTNSGDSAIKHFEFTLSGPDHMTIFVGPKNDAKIVDWSFNKTMINDNWNPPFFIYFSYGKDNSPLQFYIDIKEKTIYETTRAASLEIGIAGHWIHQEKNRTAKYKEFINSFPEYANVDDWIAYYESWIF